MPIKKYVILARTRELCNLTIMKQRKHSIKYKRKLVLILK